MKPSESAITRRAALGRLAAAGAGFAALGARPLAAETTAATNPVPDTALPAVTFHNLQPPEPQPSGGWKLNRLPAALRPLLNEGARKRSWSPAGAEIRFNLLGPEARVRLRMIDNRGEAARHLPVLVEVCRGDFLVDWRVVGTDWTELKVRAPERPELLALAAAGPRRFPPELIRIVLPGLPDIEFGGVSGDVAPARLEQVPARNYLAYGSSITNGAFAVRPGELYPARVAQALGTDHTNLGFGSGAHLEPEMADWIAARMDWDFASLEMGINLAGRLSIEEFEARVAGFLPRIVAAHPDKYIFCIDLFTGHGDFLGNPKYPAFRRVVRDAVARLASPRVVHCDGRQLLSRASGLTLDISHPSSDGFAEIASGLVGIMRPLVAPGA
jgi:hypothetical protein